MKFPSHRIDVSAKSQNLIAIQVWASVICFLVFAHSYILRVGFLRGTFSLQDLLPFKPQQFNTLLIAAGNSDSIPDFTLGWRIDKIWEPDFTNTQTMKTEMKLQQ